MDCKIVAAAAYDAMNKEHKTNSLTEQMQESIFDC
jgi:hypothetical protein